jgi:hypothetical protein
VKLCGSLLPVLDEVLLKHLFIQQMCIWNMEIKELPDGLLCARGCKRKARQVTVPVFKELAVYGQSKSKGIHPRCGLRV